MTSTEKIEGLIDAWHNLDSSNTIPLYKYIGMTHREYRKYVEEGIIPERLKVEGE